MTNYTSSGYTASRRIVAIFLVILAHLYEVIRHLRGRKMGRKSIPKGPFPASEEIWTDAFVLLQYAHRNETNPKAISDEGERLMLSDVHYAIQRFRESFKASFGQGSQAHMAECLARVYQMVKQDKLKATDQDAYRKAIMGSVGQYLLKDAEDPNHLLLVPKYFLLSKRQIIEPEPRGPWAAATHVVAQFYRRGSDGRQIKKYRANIKSGKLKFRPFEREHEGWYHLTPEYRKAVMVKSLCIDPVLADEIEKFLKQKNLALAKAAQELKLREGLSTLAEAIDKLRPIFFRK